MSNADTMQAIIDRLPDSPDTIAAFVNITDAEATVFLNTGGCVALLTDRNGELCAGVVTNNAAPELQTWLGAEMTQVDLPMFKIPEDGIVEVLTDLRRQFQ